MNKETNVKNELLIIKKQLEAVQIISRQLIIQNDLEKTLETIVIELSNRLNYINPVIYLVSEDKRSFRVRKVNVSGYVVKLVEKVIGRSIYEVKFNFKDNNVLSRVLNNGELIITDSFYKMFTPYLNRLTSNTAQKVLGIKKILAVPIKVENSIIGALSVGIKKENVEDIEIRLIKTVADQISIAIYNSSQAEIKKNQVNLLEQQNHDLQSLYNLTSRITNTLEPHKVAQNAVDSLPQDGIIIGAIISMVDKEANFLRTVAVTHNRVSDAALKNLGDLKNYDLDLTKEVPNNVLKRVLTSGYPESTTKLSEAIGGNMPETLINAISKLVSVSSVASYPLIMRGKTVGVISYFLRDVQFDDLAENQKKLLQTYSTQIAVSLENAQLFKTSQIVQENLATALSDLKETRRRERDMIDIMGHELRTPMSIVRNALSMMNYHLKNSGDIPTEKQKKYVEIGLESARREANLIETLLSATKADAKGFQLTFEKVDVEDAIKDSIFGFQNAAKKKGLELIFNVNPDKTFVYADRTRIQEVVDNFLSNAIKYTQDGFVMVDTKAEDDMVWIIIEDTGVGIAPEDLKNLGRKFYRARQHTVSDSPLKSVVRPGGTGLGLYVAFSLVKIMDGKYRVESTVNKGSKFIFGLPTYKGQEIKQEERKLNHEED